MVRSSIHGWLALGLCGCVSTVWPPGSIRDPVAIHLFSTARHAGLLLPRDDGRVVEYGYGAWGWYAQLEDEWWRAPAAVLWPNQGTLGRRIVQPGDVGESGATYGSGRLAALLVSRERAERLLADLEREFAAGGPPHRNDVYDMWFVKHPERFWFAHLCHDEVAEWLRELGCSVSPAPIRVGLRLAEH